MTLPKKTVPQIKSELDTLGIEYRSNLRKADLLSLLQETLSSAGYDPHYSPRPPSTRRRKTMAAVDIQTVTTDILKIDRRPLNHASAVIDELEADINQSEEVSVDVKITKEDIVQDEHVVSNGTETAASADGLSSEVSELRDSDEELAKAVEEIEEDEEEKPVKRRSVRLAEKKQHVACSGTLFSDDELDSPEPVETVETDNVSATSSEEARATERKRLLFKIILVSILFAVASNIIAYIHLSHPELLATLQQGFLKLFKSPDPLPVPTE